MTASVLLGVDGGGTKTTALLADRAGRVVARGAAGGSNFKAAGEAAARAAIEAAVRQAYAAAGLDFAPPLAAGLGLAGVDTPADVERQSAWAAGYLPGARIRVANDVELALWAGTPAGWGLAVIAGTGAIAYGRAPDGRAARVGGWGWLLGDEGSGFDIGLRARRGAVPTAAGGRGGPQCARRTGAGRGPR
jgi:N-acetylglucosamine kinase-like BadF-type ATPase